MHTKNVYTKLQKVRKLLKDSGIKKSGRNGYLNSGYNYYELDDFLPTITELSDQQGICSYINFESEKVILTVVDSENPESKLQFETYLEKAVLPPSRKTGKPSSEIHNLGATHTYIRRYLYMLAFEICENDACLSDDEQNTTINSKTNSFIDLKKKELNNCKNIKDLTDLMQKIRAESSTNQYNFLRSFAGEIARNKFNFSKNNENDIEKELINSNLDSKADKEEVDKIKLD